MFFLFNLALSSYTYVQVTVGTILEVVRYTLKGFHCEHFLSLSPLTDLYTVTDLAWLTTLLLLTSMAWSIFWYGAGLVLDSAPASPLWLDQHSVTNPLNSRVRSTPVQFLEYSVTWTSAAGRDNSTGPIPRQSQVHCPHAGAWDSAVGETARQRQDPPIPARPSVPWHSLSIICILSCRAVATSGHL